MRLAEFLIFALIVFVGSIVGNWLVTALKIATDNLIGQVIAYLVPMMENGF
jgi:hypothetical protein